MGGKCNHMILPFIETYLDKEFGEIDLTSRELEQLSVTTIWNTLYIS